MAYAVKQETLTPTASLIARMIDNTPEKSISFGKLEQMIFLADWKCAQSNGKPISDLAWMHDNKTVSGVGLFQRLQQDNHFVLSNPNQPGKARVSMARQFDFKLPADVERAIGTHIRFLDGQGPSALRKMCEDSYPVRSSQAGKRFQLDERILAYKKSRRETV